MKLQEIWDNADQNKQVFAWWKELKEKVEIASAGDCFWVRFKYGFYTSYPDKEDFDQYLNQDKEPIDWERAMKDAPIEVRNDADGEWEPAHFSSFSGGGVFVFGCGLTSHTKTQVNASNQTILYTIGDARFPQGVNPEDHYKD